MRKLKKYYKKIKRILELSFSLAKANFKLRNENSYLGIFWGCYKSKSYRILSTLSFFRTYNV